MTRLYAVLTLVVGALISAPAPARARSARAPATRQVVLRFDATVGEEQFSCAAQYHGIGVTGSSITVEDFRFYVSAVRLIRDDGAEVPVVLTPDGLWQQDDVALLDFEDGIGSCDNGTPETRTLIEGRAPAAHYVGVRFAVGVPFEKNHRDPTLQPSPLNLTRMFWNWNAGYKFMRIDLQTTGQPQGWVIHLGSTGCMPSDEATTVPTSCSSTNDVTVRLPVFDVDRDVVRFDLRTLLADANVDVNQEDTAAGCMSGPTDRDCAPVFRQLGLPFGDAAAGVQRAFTIRRRTQQTATGRAQR